LVVEPEKPSKSISIETITTPSLSRSQDNGPPEIRIVEQPSSPPPIIMVPPPPTTSVGGSGGPSNKQQQSKKNSFEILIEEPKTPTPTTPKSNSQNNIFDFDFQSSPHSSPARPFEFLTPQKSQTSQKQKTPTPQKQRKALLSPSMGLSASTLFQSSHLASPAKVTAMASSLASRAEAARHLSFSLAHEDDPMEFQNNSPRSLGLPPVARQLSLPPDINLDENDSFGASDFPYCFTNDSPILSRQRPTPLYASLPSNDSQGDSQGSMFPSFLLDFTTIDPLAKSS